MDAGQNNSASGTARDIATRARAASQKFIALPTRVRDAILHAIADALLANEELIKTENEKDVKEAKGKISDALMQRLKLKPNKMKTLHDGIHSIANQEEPIGSVIERMEVAKDLVLEKVKAPIGVLMIIFEARPDSLPQIAALSIRSGNGLLLKGGKEAMNSNRILHKIICDVIEAGAPSVGRDLIALVESRDEIGDLLKLDGAIDLVIPRGSGQLVSYIQKNTKIPVLGHADGICHVYVDEDADFDMALKICVDAKIDYPAACNAVEKIIVHSSWSGHNGVDRLLDAMKSEGVVVHGGLKASDALKLPRAPSDRHEYSDKAVTLEVVSSVDEAIEHINKFGSHHTDAIVTQNEQTAEDFLQRVDSACVFHNTSTRFSDGFRFGLGSEVGISTGRIHARGPVGVEGLLSDKWLLRGTGQVVDKDRNIQYTHKRLSVTPGATSLAVCGFGLGVAAGVCIAALCGLLKGLGRRS
ncbi:unnamed protein product [Ostreobium quekettii]|uniref:glutamate-5-semialdehyde dehydrogenase n=1 Tax=Ostreobium quekettii TaxID=121088 RepID=A0A8S1JDY7_9CHLO|nr:unnamed protein product [Ostreobium quekettii]|eukprot:evm.model.scf_823.8 EVM.evm.TU.scf_823.8   scf_823:39504-41648(-)